LSARSSRRYSLLQAVPEQVAAQTGGGRTQGQWCKTAVCSVGAQQQAVLAPARRNILNARGAGREAQEASAAKRTRCQGNHT
jgi:hypothetical protein